MARKSEVSTPAVDPRIPLAADVGAAPSDGARQATPPVEVVKQEIEELTVSFPIDPTPLPSEFGVHLDARLSVPQSTVLRRVALALDRSGAALANGQRITNITGAVRYLLEQMAAAANP